MESPLASYQRATLWTSAEMLPPAVAVPVAKTSSQRHMVSAMPVWTERLATGRVLVCWAYSPMFCQPVGPMELSTASVEMMSILSWTWATSGTRETVLPPATMTGTPTLTVPIFLGEVIWK